MSDAPEQLDLPTIEAARAAVPADAWLALTHREQCFVAALIRDPACDLGQAAMLAGAPPKAARQTGYKLSQRPKVKAALDAARAQVAKVIAYDGAKILRRLEENDAKAFKQGNLKASNGALALLGKACGIFEKRVRISFDDPAAALAQLKALPLDERRKAVREMLEGLG